ncbi:MAG: hypothetical protein IT439_09865 [Phycisphaerales bacterium]|nr:hypothetical protein [Phycisphaerales bacterium]
MTLCSLLGCAILIAHGLPPSQELMRQIRSRADELSRLAGRLPPHISRIGAEREAATLRSNARQVLAQGDVRRHSLLLRNAADRLASLGHSDLARALLRDLASESPSPLEAGEAWRMSAMLSARSGDPGAAEAEIVRAIDVLTRSSGGPTRGVRLRSAEAVFLSVLRESGRHAEAAAVMRTALARDREELSARQAALAQVSIARELASAGDDAGSESMWGAALSRESPLRDGTPHELLLDVEAVVRGRDPAAMGENEVNALLRLWDDPRWSGRAISLYAGHHLINALLAMRLEDDAFETGVDLCSRADQLLQDREELEELRNSSMMSVISGIVENECFRLATSSTTACDVHDRIRYAEEFLRRYPRSVNRQWVADSLARLRQTR